MKVVEQTVIRVVAGDERLAIIPEELLDKLLEVAELSMALMETTEWEGLARAGNELDQLAVHQLVAARLKHQLGFLSSLRRVH